MSIQLNQADVIAIRQLRRSPMGAAIKAVLHKLRTENRRVYEETTASEPNRVELNDSKSALHILFDQEL